MRGGACLRPWAGQLLCDVRIRVSAVDVPAEAGSKKRKGDGKTSDANVDSANLAQPRPTAIKLKSGLLFRDPHLAGGPRAKHQSQHNFDGCLVEGVLDEATQVPFTEVVTGFELKATLSDDDYKGVLEQLCDRGQAVFEAQPSRQRLVAGKEGVEFWVADGSRGAFVRRTGRQPWGPNAYDLLNSFLSASAAQHGFRTDTSASLVDLRSRLGLVPVRQPTLCRAAILFGCVRCLQVARSNERACRDECVVKAHLEKARRDTELDGLARIKGPNVPEVVRCAEEVLPSGTWHLVWLRPIGTPLSRCPYSDELFTRVGETCMRVLQRAHSVGMIHRDVTPSNILVVGVDVILNDWGSQRQRGSANSEDGTTAGFDRPVAFRGTP